MARHRSYRCFCCGAGPLFASCTGCPSDQRFLGYVATFTTPCSELPRLRHGKRYAVRLCPKCWEVKNFVQVLRKLEALQCQRQSDGAMVL